MTYYNIEGFKSSILTAPQSVCYASKMPQVDMLLGRSKIDTGKSTSSMFMPLLSLLSDYWLSTSALSKGHNYHNYS